METHPWDRHPGESDTAWSGFVLYRGLGPGRTVEAAANAGTAVSPRRRTWFTWARRWAWRERAAAWDASVDRRVLDRTADEHVARMRALGAVAAQTLALITARLATIQPDDLSSADWPRFVQAYERLEHVLSLSAAINQQRDAVAHFAETLSAAETRQQRSTGHGQVH